MKHRFAVAIVVAVLFAGSVLFAQDQGRAQKFEGTFAVQGQVIGPCGGISILAQYAIAWAEVDRYDKSGLLVQSVASYRPIGSSLFYLGDAGDAAPSNAKVVIGVPGEPEIDRINWVKKEIYGAGNIFHITVPGYGSIFAETGRTVLDISTNPPTILFNRGQNQYWDQDIAALCDYLMK